MNKELIEKTDKALEYLNEYSNYLEQAHDKCYKLGYEYSNLIPNNYEAEKQIKDFKYIKEVLQKLDEEEIDLDKTIFQKVDNLLISDGDNEEKTFNIYTNSLTAQNVLGKYKTKERAIEILDTIQKILTPVIINKPIVKETTKPQSVFKTFEQIGSNSEIKELSTCVFEMPKE